MQLITMICTIKVVTDPRAISKAEALASLLTNCNTRRGRCSTITLTELFWVSKCFNSRAKLLGGDQIQILDVVCVLWGGFSSRRRLGNSRKTIPGKAFLIRTR